MTAEYSGTRQERFARLDKIGRRCDANSRNCVNSATLSITLIKADGDGEPLPGEQQQTRLACSWHRKFFTDNGLYHIVSIENMPVRRVAQPAWRREQYLRQREGGNH